MMSQTVVMSIHGMNSPSAGAKSIDKLALGLNVDHVDVDGANYGFAGLLKIWFFKRPSIERIAMGIKKWIDNSRIKRIFLLCHSNGLNFAIQALNLLKELNYLTAKKIIIVSYSGCANRKVNTDNSYHVYNWYTERDGWLFIAKWLPSWTMGSFGRGVYRGKSKNVTNKRITNHVSSHSQWFKGKTLKNNIKKTEQLIREYI